jgi:hypothetical protein
MLPREVGARRNDHGLSTDFLMRYFLFLAAMGVATAIMLLFYFADHGVLATAAKYADDEPELVKFMRDMGYPKAGDWCGEFAASIIKKAGGVPPSGAAVASNWRRYGTADAMPHVGDVAVAVRGVPTGATGSHVGFVTDVNLENDTFTLESGNAGNIYTTRKISCFSFHTPPNDVLSALTGVPSGTAIGKALAGPPLSRTSIRAYPVISWANIDDCGQRTIDADNHDELQDDSWQRGQASVNGLDGARVCVVHLPSDAPRFCPYARMARVSTMYRPHGRCIATTTTTIGKQCLAWRARASACFI